MTRTFQIEDDSKVLILEDDQFERQDWFRKLLPQATLVRNPLVAIEALRAKTFDWVFLDHDVPCPIGMNGSHVAHELIEMKFKGTVVVHSANYFGAKMIGKILRVAGIRSAVQEFGGFEISNSFEVIGAVACSTDGKIDLGEID